MIRLHTIIMQITLTSNLVTNLLYLPVVYKELK